MIGARDLPILDGWAPLDGSPPAYGAAVKFAYLFGAVCAAVVAVSMVYGLREPDRRDAVALAPSALQPPKIPTPEAKPAAPAPAPAATPAPQFDVVRVMPGGEAVIAGRAAPGSVVTVFDGNRPLGEVTADRRGEWVLLPANPLSPGSRELSLAARLNGESQPAERVVVLVVPEAPRAGEPAAALAVAVPREGPGGSTVLQAPPHASAEPAKVEPAKVSPGGSSTRGLPPLPPGGV